MDNNYHRQQVIDPEEERPSMALRNRANSRMMMDGNENLLENDTDRMEGPNDNLAAIFARLPGCDEY